MDEVLQELTKPQWWVSVVIAGIAINLISAYLKKPVDRLLVAGPAWLRARSARKKAEWERLVDAMVRSQEERHFIMHLITRLRISAVHFLVFSILFLALPSAMATLGRPIPKYALTVCLAAMAFAFFASFRAFLRSVWFTNALYEVRSCKN